ncbi:MAG: hypothetical protein Q8M07_30105 [Prosthecobacter sp.]|nr:hypothetical protein [Prosthecobacter sp.]
MKTPRFLPWVLGFNLACLVLPTQAQEGLLKKAVFCHGLKEDQSPKDTAEFFRNDETVYLSIELKGRPKTGIVAAKFMFRDDLLADAHVDVATVNEGVIFSFGQNTFVGFNVTHKEPLPVGDCYTADVTFNDQPLGRFPFKVAPPKDAIPSKVLRVTMAKDADEDQRAVDETREFAGTEKAVLVGVGNLGLSSWLEASWKVGGKVDDAGTRSFTMKENKNDVPFSFSFVPAGGWPAGTHEVSLMLDGQEVANEKFTVKVGAPMAGKTKLVLDSSRLFRDDGNGEEGKEVKAFSADDTMLHARWNLKEKALAKGVQFVWVLVEAEGEKEQVIATADIEPAVSDQITSSLTTKKGLPVGRYRIDLLQDGKVLDSKPFEVK